jgi:hypothetical protein
VKRRLCCVLGYLFLLATTVLSSKTQVVVRFSLLVRSL